MEQLHAHEVLHMMEGNSYSEASLKEAIVKTFGEDQRFYTCSAENMDADELIVFLKQKGKFMPIENGFTVDITKVSNHKRFYDTINDSRLKHKNLSYRLMA